MNSTCARWGGRYLAATHRLIPPDALSSPAVARTRAGSVVDAPLVAMFPGGLGNVLFRLPLGCGAAIAIRALPGAGHMVLDHPVPDHPVPDHPVPDIALLHLKQAVPAPA